MTADRRRTRAIAAAAALLTVGLGLGLYASRSAPRGWPEHAWLLGPPAGALEEAARVELGRAARILQDDGRPLAERLAAYRERLGAADRLLVRALRANPAQPRALAELTAVRFELDPPADERALRPHLERIALAARIAPRVPAVQRRLGELLLAMGMRPEGLVYLARALELDPSLAAGVVERLRLYLPSPGEALAALPPRPEVLLALEDWFIELGSPAELLAALERSGIGDDPRLLRAYGRACLAAGLAEQLERRMTALETDRAETAAERLVQRSLARRRLGDLAGSVADARAALDGLPASDRLAEHLGRTLLHAGEGDEAAAALREALRLAAAVSAPAARRAVLYRLVGQAEEAAGRPHVAYDAYKRALRLDPGEPVAARRVREMEAAPR